MKDGTHYRTRAQNFLRENLFENLLIARSDPGNDLDPSLVHRLEPLSLLLGILVWDGADGVAALALAVGGLHHHVRVLMTILSTSISVSARLSSDDRSRRAHVDARRQSRAPCRWRPRQRPAGSDSHNRTRR
jgi:hypothetical protein